LRIVECFGAEVVAATQNQAASALVFLYERVLRQPLARMDMVRAKEPVRIPTVLAPEEVTLVLAELTGVHVTVPRRPEVGLLLSTPFLSGRVRRRSRLPVKCPGAPFADQSNRLKNSRTTRTFSSGSSCMVR